MVISGQRVVILGGTGSFGSATARLALTQGAEVVVASSSPQRVDALVAELGHGASGMTTDINDEPSLAAFFEEVGGFDHLVTTIGDTRKVPTFRDGPVAEAKVGFEARFWGQYNAARLGSAKISRNGSISFTSAASSQKSMHSAVIGGAVNSAIEGLTRQLAVELAPIRVNAVAPGVMATGRWDAMPTDQRDAFFAKVGGSIPAGRVGTAEEVAEAFVFLMRNGFVTGSTVFVEGGAIVAP